MADNTKEKKPKKQLSKAEKKKRAKQGFMVFAALVICVSLFFVIVNNLVPAPSVEENNFIVGKGELPMIAAHRGGADNFPENTMLAYLSAVGEIGVEMLESDVHLTKDGYLVYNHDDYIDETCNVNGDISFDEVRELCRDKSKRHYIRDMTLAELESYNFGYYFEDENGERPFKDVADIAGAGLQIATVERLFESFYIDYPELLFSVEIKDSGERGHEAADILVDTIERYPTYKNRIVIGSFHNEVENYIKENYPDMLRGASIETAAAFILTHYVGLNYFDPSDFAALQIPMCFDDVLDIEIWLDDAGIVDRAHKRNISVQYWTINDPDEMRRLIEIGCDVIMTDNPRLLREILNEYK